MITKNKLSWGFLVLGVIGFFDSLYLVITHFTNDSVICDGVNKCDLVLTSSYSTLFGIPVALFGVLFYSTIIIIASIMKNETKINSRIITNLLSISTSLALFASIWFLYLQIYVINAYCVYCLISALVSSILFILAILNRYISVKK
jgi:uncharacterized membrane protein